MDLREYEQAKFQLAEVLRQSGAASSQLPQQLQNQVRELFSRLAEDRFNLVVVGRFSRGKTSLMNAVLGTDRLPTGIRPLTSVITTVTYGTREQAVIHFAGLGIPQDIPLGALSQYVTEEGNSGNHRRVSIAQVQLPVELLRRGFHFIDTPGLGSPIVENTRTTERFLPEADAFILVTSYEGPLSDEEVRFLRSAAAAGQPAFVVVNKQDMVSAEEREQALAYLREQLRGLLEARNLGIFSLSARDGLIAKQKGDAALLAASGVAAFEAELVRYLITEKSREFLLRMCHRIGGVLAALPRRPETTTGSERLAMLARQVGGARGTAVTAATIDNATALGAQPKPCEICAHVTERLFDFLRHFQYDITVNPEKQRQLAGSGGLCSFHTWLYEQMSSPQGTCIGFADVLDRWASRLSAFAAPASGLGSNATADRRRLALDTGPCAACDVRVVAETTAVNALAGRLRAVPDLALASVSDICLPHLRLLSAALGEHPVATRLLARQGAVLQRMADNLRRYALKHDGLRRYLASDEEEKAAERALFMLAGHRTLNTSTPLFLPAVGFADDG
ncbi:MAG TPA: dynamin family protein [Stellaceae bacterium]|nr:dynamin family protein [Stellaceae bacterium]